MEMLAFVAVVAAVLVAVHLAVAAYLYRASRSTESEGPTDGATTDGTTTDDRPQDPPDRPVEPTDEKLPCPICGVPNDPSYRFCRRCVADLTGDHRTSARIAAARLGS